MTHCNAYMTCTLQADGYTKLCKAICAVLYDGGSDAALESLAANQGVDVLFMKQLHGMMLGEAGGRTGWLEGEAVEGYLILCGKGKDACMHPL